ncbi:MAG TPA: hypothetical protein V6D33_04945 [Cyanophyceae cyanobacterium]
MPKTLINLTLLKLNEELDNILAEFQTSTYRTTLTDQELRQSLMVYVLNRMPNRHLVIETEQISCLYSLNFLGLIEESLTMQNLVHQGIYYLNRNPMMTD